MPSSMVFLVVLKSSTKIFLAKCDSYASWCQINCLSTYRHIQFLKPTIGPQKLSVKKGQFNTNHKITWSALPSSPA